ncbi:glycerate kinase family protein [Tuanshanicoccus lijuaniae]|uniref:glycerate kinase family protein n=1 Tax=Aerococcaceae bacterium zg-1292 TaxID=2774330 RepID=UPI001BD8BD62|nr:glycerate kinase [Aerococcaceae bacterium zg-A91]MBS4457467.1 glycerate kinase [Aerococcaceae bacterium zg-BR33]
MSKKIVIASDSFKGSASSKEIGEYIAEGIRCVRPEYNTEIYSIADGGEGTVDAILDVIKGEYVSLEVQGPLGKPVQAHYALVDEGKTAIIEMAEASGITLVDKNELNIMRASTYGTGQLIKDAIERGVSKIYIGIGGSATNDGGLGMAQALGFEFFDSKENKLSDGAVNLEKIVEIQSTNALPGLETVETIIISDVTNPLCGPNGASEIYGPQKGASVEQIKQLDRALSHYADVLEKEFGKKVKHLEGAGAAGGLGAGLMVYLNAKASRGIDTILNLIKIEEAISNADLVITGEGSLDGQSINGKAPVGIAKIAQKYGVPTIAIVGSKSRDIDAVYEAGISGVFDIINQPMSLEDAIHNTPQLVTAAAKNIIHLFSTLNRK